MSETPNIDERLQAIAQNLAALARDIEADRAEQRSMDRRERRARRLLLKGIDAYLQALNSEDPA